jgi:hypothetical protein
MWLEAGQWSVATDGRTALRGANWGSEEPVLIVPSPANRMPVSTPLHVHMLVDDFFERRFGVRFRSRALFATSNPTTAAKYGAVRQLVPQADFCYCWSPVVADLFEELLHKDPNEPFGDFLDRMSYRCHDLAGALESGNEVMLVGAKFEAHHWGLEL